MAGRVGRLLLWSSRGAASTWCTTAAAGQQVNLKSNTVLWLLQGTQLSQYLCLVPPWEAGPAAEWCTSHCQHFAGKSLCTDCELTSSTDATWLQAAVRPHFALVCTKGCTCGICSGAAEGGVQRCRKCDNGRQPAEQREECCKALSEAAFPEHACHAAVSMSCLCCYIDALPEARLSRYMLIMQQ